MITASVAEVALTVELAVADSKPSSDDLPRLAVAFPKLLRLALRRLGQAPERVTEGPFP